LKALHINIYLDHLY